MTANKTPSNHNIFLESTHQWSDSKTQHLEHFLKQCQSLNGALPKRKCFISYRWDPNKKKCDDLQKKLEKLKEYLELLGAEVTLDIRALGTDIDYFMEQVKDKNSDFVFLIGTPELKDRVDNPVPNNAKTEYSYIRERLKANRDANKSSDFLIPMIYDDIQYKFISVLGPNDEKRLTKGEIHIGNDGPGKIKYSVIKPGGDAVTDYILAEDLECNLVKLKHDPREMAPLQLKEISDNKPCYFLFSEKLFYIEYIGKDFDTKKLTELKVSDMTTLKPIFDNLVCDFPIPSTKKQRNTITNCTGHKREIPSDLAQFPSLYANILSITSSKGHTKESNPYRTAMPKEIGGGFEFKQIDKALSDIKSKEGIIYWKIKDKKIEYLLQDPNKSSIQGEISSNDLGEEIPEEFPSDNTNFKVPHNQIISILSHRGQIEKYNIMLFDCLPKSGSAIDSCLDVLLGNKHQGIVSVVCGINSEQKKTYESYKEELRTKLSNLEKQYHSQGLECYGKLKEICNEIDRKISEPKLKNELSNLQLQYNQNKISYGLFLKQANALGLFIEKIADEHLDNFESWCLYQRCQEDIIKLCKLQSPDWKLPGIPEKKPHGLTFDAQKAAALFFHRVVPELLHPDAIARDLIYIIGNTRVGKSTFVNLAIGNDVIVEEEGEMGTTLEIVNCRDGKRYPRIGAGISSETQMPSVYEDSQKRAFCDTSGFRDSGGSIVRSRQRFSLLASKTLAKSVQAVVVMISSPELSPEMLEKEEGPLSDLCKTLNIIFDGNNLSEFGEQVIFVVNCKNDWDLNKETQVIKRIENFSRLLKNKLDTKQEEINTLKISLSKSAETMEQALTFEKLVRLTREKENLEKQLVVLGQIRIENLILWRVERYEKDGKQFLKADIAERVKRKIDAIANKKNLKKCLHFEDSIDFSTEILLPWVQSWFATLIEYQNINKEINSLVALPNDIEELDKKLSNLKVKKYADELKEFALPIHYGTVYAKTRNVGWSLSTPSEVLEAELKGPYTKVEPTEKYAPGNQEGYIMDVTPTKVELEAVLEKTVEITYSAKLEVKKSGPWSENTKDERKNTGLPVAYLHGLRIDDSNSCLKIVKLKELEIPALKKELDGIKGKYAWLTGLKTWDDLVKAVDDLNVDNSEMTNREYLNEIHPKLELLDEKISIFKIELSQYITKEKSMDALSEAKKRFAQSGQASEADLRQQMANMKLRLETTKGDFIKLHRGCKLLNNVIKDTMPNNEQDQYTPFITSYEECFPSSDSSEKADTHYSNLQKTMPLFIFGNNIRKATPQNYQPRNKKPGPNPNKSSAARTPSYYEDKAKVPSMLTHKGAFFSYKLIKQSVSIFGTLKRFVR